MSFKTTYILFLALIGILGLLLVTQLRGPKRGEETAYVLPSLNQEKIENKDINGVEIERPGSQADKIVFFRREAGWAIQQPQTRADTSQATDILSELMRASKVEDKADMSGGLAQYRLEAPLTYITIRHSS